MLSDNPLRTIEPEAFGHIGGTGLSMFLGRIQDLTKWGSDKRPPRAVAPTGGGGSPGHAPPEKF